MPFNVLLVEDNPPDVMLVRKALLEHGLEFTLYANSDAEQALAYIDRMGEAGDSPCPDVVLLDLNVPKGEGVDLLDAVRNSPKCPNVPCHCNQFLASPAGPRESGSRWRHALFLQADRSRSVPQVGIARKRSPPESVCVTERRAEGSMAIAIRSAQTDVQSD